MSPSSVLSRCRLVLAVGELWIRRVSAGNSRLIVSRDLSRHIRGGSSSLYLRAGKTASSPPRRTSVAL
ncbi:Protein of unknown function [Gryllus bimaculatus]|nr:Protein of unknown function [Gryllus bimaculatus]